MVADPINITNIFTSILGQGFVGVMLALSLWINWLLYKENKSLQNLRVGDAQRTQDTMLAPMKNLQQTLDLVVTLLQKARDDK